jgi:hypothetical protein
MEPAAATPAGFSKDEAKAKAVDMLEFINAAWTPYHAVEEASRRLMKAGFQHIAEKDAWKLKPGGEGLWHGSSAAHVACMQRCCPRCQHAEHFAGLLLCRL